MKVVEKNVLRLAVVQHLRSTYNIKTKNWNKQKSNKLSSNQTAKVFGVALDALPCCPLLDFGTVPSFLVDACSYLLDHGNTEGLFRKSGSVVRLKALRAKLDEGEDCLVSALAVDVAALLKQFFRELPEPVVPLDLQSSLLKAQELPTQEQRNSATMLLSCVLPQRNINTLRYFFSFLQSIAHRSAENKMDSSNLSVILAPNLLHSDGADKMNAATERRLKLQAAMVHCFIENARDFGVVPPFLQRAAPALLGEDAVLFSPGQDQDSIEEPSSTTSALRKSQRRSLGVFSSATPVTMTPRTKRKLPLDMSQSQELSNKKRRSLKKNLGLELRPHALFGTSSTPGSVHSASGCSPVVGSSARITRLTASSARRKSKRLSYRTHQINRHESGKTGCFSPRVPKKEAAVKRSLRQRFSLGKGLKEAAFGAQSVAVTKGSETIGWRLATQESTTSFQFFTQEPQNPRSPAVVLHNKHAGTAPKFMSKSEDNLLSPQSDPDDLHNSWGGATPRPEDPFLPDTPMNVCLRNNYFSSEPAIATTTRSPAAATIATVCNLPKSLCCTTSAESLDSACSVSVEMNQGGPPTLLKIKRPVRGDASDVPDEVKKQGTPTGGGVSLQLEDTSVREETAGKTLAECGSYMQSPVLPPGGATKAEQDVTFGQIEIVPLSPLHIDSGLFDCGSWDVRQSKRPDALGGSLDASTCAVFGSCDSLDAFDEAPQQANCSQLVDALDIHSPLVFRLVSAGFQSTPSRPQQEIFQQPIARENSQGERGGQNRPGPPQATQNSPEPRSDHDPEPRPDPVDKACCDPDILLDPVDPTSSGIDKVAVKDDSAPAVMRVAMSGDAPRAIRVAEQIQRFNMLTLRSPQSRARCRGTRSPLLFQRTPVRQSVRRINSLLERSRVPGVMQKTTSLDAGVNAVTTLVAQATSLDTGINTNAPLHKMEVGMATDSKLQGFATVSKGASFSKPRPPVPPKRYSIRNPAHIPALGDLTNRVARRVKGDVPIASNQTGTSSKVPNSTSQKGQGVQVVSTNDIGGCETPCVRSSVQLIVDRETGGHYRGSPRNPLNAGRLLSATKPIDL